MWALPLNGCLQATSAIYTFTNLVSAKKDSGFYGDVGPITHVFVKENLFYQLMVLMGALYFDDRCYRSMGPEALGVVGSALARAAEVVGVFLPYVLIRPLFPMTHFRDSSDPEAAKKSRSPQNERFYAVGRCARVLLSVVYAAVDCCGNAAVVCQCTTLIWF